MVLKIGGRDLELTVDEARELRKALEQLFGDPAVRVEKEYIYIPQPYYVPSHPWWKYGGPVWTCDNSTSGNAKITWGVQT